ncbi:alpha/beta hydrolase family protein [Nocardia coubleae]|uniref:Alpha/beta hydrolase n=1 Tax=Nocardia coubleae TaxID=356147 RepID=A0A846WAL4_9NOCA|nr:lipase family protein [Nocardia coubleae]NKX90321.1 alpha/beta hydrolase [Nocardia coubleae]
MRTALARIVAAVAVTCLSTVGCADDSFRDTEPAAGAPTSDFYTADGETLPGARGSVIRTRSLPDAVPGARTELILYRSIDAHGATVAVSGTVSVPPGTPPVGGWPLISFAPGTNGVADVCAPSRADGASPTRDELARWVAAGYAVARTDYQGLGTPGGHGYLIGETEQRAVADIVVAAREFNRDIGARWVAMGHSQGGHAALFAASASGGWAPAVDLLGAVALAPASHLAEQVRMAKWAVSNPLGSVGTGGLAVYLPMLVRGAQTVTELDPARFLTERAVSMLPLADTDCAAALSESGKWGGLSVKDVLERDGDLSGLLRVLDDNDPSGLSFTEPVLVLQGRDDHTVPLKSTDAMVAQQQMRGQAVDYRKYDGVDHSEIISASFTDALGWVDTRFGITR